MALKKNIYLFIYFLIVKSVLSYTYALHVKGIVHPKKKMYYPQTIQDVDEFVPLWEPIWRNLALLHLLTNGSCAVNGCRQN